LGSRFSYPTQNWGGFSICSSIRFVYQKNSSITYARNNLVGTYVQIVDVGIKTWSASDQGGKKKSKT